MTGKIQLWGHQIAVDWAEPEQEVDEEIMDQVCNLYLLLCYIVTQKLPLPLSSPLERLLRCRRFSTFLFKLLVFAGEPEICFG